MSVLLSAAARSAARRTIADAAVERDAMMLPRVVTRCHGACPAMRDASEMLLFFERRRYADVSRR
jgi:hypothetical protein